MAITAQLQVWLTGRVRFAVDDAFVDERGLAGRQGRLLFAYLVAQRGRPVPREELAEALWRGTPPASWEKALTVLASKLRAVLAGAGVEGGLTGAFGCYRLDLPDGAWIDIVAADDSVQKAEAALSAGNAKSARAAAAHGEELLQQPFLPGEEGAWVDARRRELVDLRVRALDVLAEACLGLDDAAAAATWAEQALELEPFRESGYRRAMEAHAAAGNRGQALLVYDRCRRLLADELGSYPSPETETLYRRLLELPQAEPGNAQTETAPTDAIPAATPVESHRPPRVARPPAVVAVVAAGVVAAVCGVVAVFAFGAPSRRAVAPNSVVAMNESGSIAAVVPVGAQPAAIAYGAGALWVANLADQSVSRIDPASRHPLRAISVESPPAGLAATRTAAWITDGRGTLLKIDPLYDRLTPTWSSRAPGSGFYGPSTARPTLAAFGSVWVVSPDGYVSRIDPASGRVLASVGVGNDPSAIAAGKGSVWVTNRSDGTLTRIDRIDRTTLGTTSIPVGHSPAAVVVNDAGAWVADAGDDTVVRVDTDTNAATTPIPVGSRPTALLATPSAVWVANAGDGTVMRLDPRSGQRLGGPLHVGGTPDALAFAAGRIWVAVAPPLPQPAAGGVLRVESQDDWRSLDPAIDDDAQVLDATCASLVTYPDEAGPAGKHIIPEVAVSVPTPTAGGKTYTFTIRRGFHFSPPSNKAVTAATFKSTIERVANPQMQSTNAPVFSGIVGYEQYRAGKARGISGITARGQTLTIRLTRPDGGLLDHLTAGFACAVPQDTPPVALNEIPSAGPYYISSYTPRRQLILRRNPNYSGQRPHHLDEIVDRVEVDPSRAISDVEAGKADYARVDIPTGAVARLAAEYGPGSKAARAGHQQYFVNEANGARYLHMNTSRPLFADPRLRRAVNYAIDRKALVEQEQRSPVSIFSGGPPIADYLTPSIAGARNFHLYPLTPDLRRAKRLAGHVHATAILYASSLPPWPQEAQIIHHDLRPLGIDVQIHEFPQDDFFARLQRRGEPFDLAVSGWEFGTADPADDLELFDGSTIGRTNNLDFSYFSDPTFTRRLHAVEKLSGAKRYRAASRLAYELERHQAPVAAISIGASQDFFSKRIGCQVYQPESGMDLAALCLRD